MVSQRQLFLSHIAQTSDYPLMLEIVKAEGCFVFDSQGRKYLDLISGISVSQLGHNNREISAALKEQIDKYLHVMVYGEFIQSPQNLFAEKILSLLPEKLDNVYFVNSGSEATEGALKLAKRYTGRPRIVSFTNAYHGSTHGALSVAGDENLRNSFRPLLPGISRIPFNSQAGFEAIDENTAAVIVEPIQGEAGAVVPNPEFIRALRKRCDQTGALLIFDEIQSGFGRSGKMWAFEHFNVQPDILLIGKAMGGGLPMGGFISSREIMQVLKTDPVLGHISTFGGHPLPCTSGLTALNILMRDKLVEDVRRKENLFRKGLRHPAIKAVHGMGLLMAVELQNKEMVGKVIGEMVEQQVISDWFVFNDKCIRLAPPLIISDSEIDFACQAIFRSLDKITSD